MYPYVRLVKTFLNAILRRRTLSPLEPATIQLRVWPGDLDFNLHLNDGRYLTLMDLGRVDLLTRVGLARPMIRSRWLPVVATARIEYRREVRAFQKLRLTTRIVGWDDKWLFIQQELHRGEMLVSTCLLRGGLLSRDGMVPPARILESLRLRLESPPLPAAARHL